MTEGQKYHRLMLAIHGLAEGKKLSDRILDKDNDGWGIRFGIDEILTGTAFVSREKFDVDDLVIVKAAFAQLGKRYPGDTISECVAVLLGLKA